MEKSPLLIIAGKNENQGKDVSIQIEPSVSMLTSMANLFRSQGQFLQAAEISRLGVDYYPQVPAMRVLAAICRLELGDVEAARREMASLAAEIRPLSPGLQELGELAQRRGLNDLAEWSILLAQVLDKYPREAPSEAELPGLDTGTPKADSLVVPTLKKWLAQLQNTE
jgi:hypothetical protein